MRKYLERKGFYDNQGFERPQRALKPKAMQISQVSESDGSPPHDNVGVSSPSMGHNIPSLNLKKLESVNNNNKAEEVKDIYGMGNDPRISKPETDRSALATGRSVFERNTF